MRSRVSSAVFLASGCSSETTASPRTIEVLPALSSSTSVRPLSEDCLPRQEIADAELSMVADRLASDIGVTVFSIRMSPKVEEPEAYSLTVNLCARQTRAVDDLRPVATQVAGWLKRHPISKTVSRLTVTDLGRTKRPYTEQLFDEKFQEHSWSDNQPSSERDAIWTIRET